MCALTNRSELGVNNIYTLKPAVLDTLFTLKMGSDRLSMQVTKLALKIIKLDFLYIGFGSSYCDYWLSISLKSIILGSTVLWINFFCPKYLHFLVRLEKNHVEVSCFGLIKQFRIHFNESTCILYCSSVIGMLSVSFEEKIFQDKLWNMINDNISG